MIPVVHVPNIGPIIARPKPQPLWDVEHMAPGQTAPLDFFQRCRGEAFANSEAARARVDRSWKTPRDTNVLRSGGCPLLSHTTYGLSHVVLYPDTEGVLDVDEYRAAVERLRQTATLQLNFGSTIFAEFPLCDVMANVMAASDSMPREGEFDPSDAPGLLHRRGVDVSIWLSPPERTKDDLKAWTGWSICICKNEDFRVRVLPGPQGGEAVAIRAYLVGTHLVGITG